MLISIITVVKNDLVRLKETVSSLEYVYNDDSFEHIIVDGNSKDNTKSFIKNIQRNCNNVIYNSSHDHGIYDAMNKGFKLSKGDFIIFLNAGDRLIANKKNLTLTLKKFIETEINIICFPYKHEFLDQSILRCPKRINKDKLPTSHQAMFFSKLFLNNNEYNLDYKFGSDFDLYLRSDPKNIIIISEFEPISVVELNGITSKNLTFSYGEYKKIISKNFFGIFKVYLLVKISIKVTIVMFLKKIFSRNITFIIRKLLAKL